MKEKVFIDANILINAFATSKADLRNKCYDYIINSLREKICISTIFLWIEVMPKVLFEKNEEHLEFYRNFFGICKNRTSKIDSYRIINKAKMNALGEIGIGGIDGFHVASCEILKCKLITMESRKKQFGRCKTIEIEFL